MYIDYVAGGHKKQLVRHVQYKERIDEVYVFSDDDSLFTNRYVIDLVVSGIRQNIL